MAKRKLSMEKIRQAVCAHRGGWEKASDAEIRAVWNSLSADTQQQYINNLKTEKGKDNAVSTGTEQNV